MPRLVIVNENDKADPRSTTVKDLPIGTWFTTSDPTIDGNFIYFKGKDRAYLAGTIGRGSSRHLGEVLYAKDDSFVHTILDAPKFKIET